MEPPPGPCSSPPGPRPVPPPRKGSMERRPLSPLRKGGEHSGAWDAAGDVSARERQPGSPERVTVTQRVLIVMQSHASPPPAAITSHGPSAEGSTPIPSRGASPTEGTPRTSAPKTPDRGPSPTEGTPIMRGPKTPPPDRGPSPTQGTPITSAPKTPPPDRGPSPTDVTPRTSAGKSSQSPPKEIHGEPVPGNSTIQDWGVSDDVSGHSSGAPPHCTGARDHLSSQPGKGARVQGGVTPDGSDAPMTDGAPQSVTPPHTQSVTAKIFTPEIIETNVIPAGTEEVKGAAPPSSGEVKGAAPPSSGEVKGAAPPSSGEVKGAAPPSSGEVKGAAPPSSGEVKGAAPPSSGEVKGAAPPRPEDIGVIPTIKPEDVNGAPAVRREDVQSISPSPTTQQEGQQKRGAGPVVGNPTSQPSLGWSSLSPSRVPDPSSPHRNVSSKPPLPIPLRSNLYPGPPPREQETPASHETVSLSSFKSKAPAPDTLSYLDSVSLMSGTMESLTLLDDASSIGSDSEINGMPYRKTDKYGFLGGNQYSGNGEAAIPVEIARQRELKWLEMFSNWDKWLTRRFQKVKLRCRKGIPSSLRAKAWQLLCNSHDLLMKNPGKFEEMERQQGDPKWLDVIEKDLHRQFPFHEMFAARGGHGQQDLYRILKAYTIYRPEEGYCQAQAPVAAVLLMHMPAEQAFWCLVQICDKYLPGYYSAGLEAIQLDGEIFFALLRRVCPMAYRHLKKFKIDPILYMTEWFMCIFSRTLPWASVLRVWDMFFCEGVKIVFRVGLVLLRHTLGSVDKLRSCQGMYETMEKLRSLPVHCMQEEVLLPEVSSLPVTDALIERESNTQLRKWRENRGELQYRPSRRLHGARQIHEEKLRLNPSLSGSRLSLSSIRRPSPPPTPPLAVQPESMVVSEGLRPALPSPTSNKAPLGPPKEATKKSKEKQREQEKKREKEERERERKREKEEREERRKEKERERQKEREEKRLQKEREKAEARQKKERRFSFRRKESAADSPPSSGPGAAAHDTYF